MDNLNKNILKLALPSILANITIPIVGMVDIAIAGHLEHFDGEASMLIGGITIGSMLFDLLYWSFGFLRAGTGGLTAQAYGRNDLKAASATLIRSLGIAIIASILLIIVQWIVVEGAFLFVKCSPATRELASEYFYIRIWAAPAALSLMAFKGWFIGMQDTVSSMMTDITVVGVNVLASLFLAFGFGGFNGIGYNGIAVGTVIAQYTGLILAILLLMIKYSSKVFGHFQPQQNGKIKELVTIFNSPDTKLFFKTNRDLYIRSLCFIGTYMGFTTIAARYGDMALASSAIIMKLMMFFSYFTDGFAYAGEALTGRFIGAEEPVNVRKTVRYTFAWSLAIALGFVFINGAFATTLFNIMTSDTALIQFSQSYIIWLILVPLVGCPAFVWDGIYVGATYTKALRDSALLSVSAFYIFWFVIAAAFGVLTEIGVVHDKLALHILLLAYFSHLLMRTAYQSYLYIKKKGAFRIL